jgi:hypothetical protein
LFGEGGVGAVEITLDRQVFPQHCPECEADFTVVRGSVYDGGQGFGLYLIALHGHSPQGRLGHLAIALLGGTGGQPVPLAAAMDVIATPEQFGFALVEWESSPWRGEAYLGRMLSPAEVRASPHRPTFFHIAEHVVDELPEVRAYFADPDAAPGRPRD